jgi:hypothetical protein
LIVFSTYIKNHDCPSHFGGGSTEDELISQVLYSEIKVDSLQQILSLTVDGGSTEDLVNDIQLSTPPDALEIRNNLLYESPYLSDSVMKEAIEKENVLQNNMIRDVLVENPQSAKSDRVFEALGNRFLPMPDSLMAQIMQNENVSGEKEKMENTLLFWNQKYSGALKFLLVLYDTDTTGTYGIDSIINALEQDGSLNSQYDLISLYFSKGMYATGNEILAAIPGSFPLTNEQINDFDQFTMLFPMIQKIDSSSQGTTSLDSSEIETLVTLAQNDHLLSGAYSRNILLMNYDYQYEEPIILPSHLKISKRINRNYNLSDLADLSWVKIYPNPSNSYIIVEFRIEVDDFKASNYKLTITDLKGNSLGELVVTKPYDQMIIPTNDLSSGEYMLKINSNQKDKLCKKFILIK